LKVGAKFVGPKKLWLVEFSNIFFFNFKSILKVKGGRKVC
jgi:hypothetical protein